MTPRFADSFYFLAMLNPADMHHEAVMAASAGMPPRIITTAWVLTEVADAMAEPRNRPLFLRLIHELDHRFCCTVVPASSGLYEAGLDLYAHRLDKAWSLTDCISFVVMEQHGLIEALTRDHHFEQAGFAVLFK